MCNMTIIDSLNIANSLRFTKRLNVKITILNKPNYSTTKKDNNNNYQHPLFHCCPSFGIHKVKLEPSLAYFSHLSLYLIVVPAHVLLLAQGLNHLFYDYDPLLHDKTLKQMRNMLCRNTHTKILDGNTYLISCFCG